MGVMNEKMDEWGGEWIDAGSCLRSSGLDTRLGGAWDRDVVRGTRVWERASERDDCSADLYRGCASWDWDDLDRRIQLGRREILRMSTGVGLVVKVKEGIYLVMRKSKPNFMILFFCPLFSKVLKHVHGLGLIHCMRINEWDLASGFLRFVSKRKRIEHCVAAASSWPTLNGAFAEEGMTERLGFPAGFSSLSIQAWCLYRMRELPDR